MNVRNAVAVGMLFVAPMLFADDADVIKGLQNLTIIHRLAVLGEMSTLGGVINSNVPNDPWGTPYRFEVTASGYRVAGAGSDKTFDESKWGTREQFRNLEDDVVFENSRVIRTNRTWLHEQVTDVTRPDLEALRQAELFFMTTRTPAMRSIMARRTTQSNIESIAAHVTAGGELPPAPRDAWGTPLRIENTEGKLRIVSAGADRQFNEQSWSAEATASADEDIVFENGGFTRNADEKAILRSAGVQPMEPLSQPPDATHAPTETANAVRVGGDVKAPVVVTRVEPTYGEDYRRARISGIVVLETIIGEDGSVREVRVIKSLAPDLDMSAANAVRQWKFQPGTLNGKPVPVIFNLTINFKLS